MTYIDGVFEYETSVTVSLTQRKNYIYLQGGIQFRVGSFSGDISNTIIYQLSDYLGSAGTRLDDTGGIIDKEEYYPYGDSSLRTFSSKRYRYIGKEKDEESGLYQMGARYYAPWTCKFISVDPLAAKYAHQSSYCYGNCNPIVFKDPSGMGGDPTTDPKKGGDNKSGGSGGGPVINLDNILDKMMDYIRGVPGGDVKNNNNGTNPTNTPPVQTTAQGSGTSTTNTTTTIQTTPKVTFTNQYGSFDVPDQAHTYTIPSNPIGTVLPQSSPQMSSITVGQMKLNEINTQAIQYQQRIDQWNADREAIDPTAYGVGTSPAVQATLGVAIPEVGALQAGSAVAHGYQTGNKVEMGLGVVGMVGITYSVFKPTAPVASTPDGSYYSVAYEMQLPSNLYPGGSYYQHFKAANEALDAAMKTDVEFANQIKGLGIEIPRRSSGIINGKSPENWVWHHDITPGTMQLVSKLQHPDIPGGIFWEVMHPGGIGGMTIWNKK